jgi:O-methyltransferase involved in polyketide biosynthesis
METLRIKADHLTGVAETLLIPLLARGVETRRPDALFRDPLALEMLERLDCDVTRFAKDWMTQTGIAIRTEILDAAVRRFLARNPAGLVVNLGAGLCTRFFRLDNGQVEWIDLDLPEVIQIKREFLDEQERYRFLAHSVLDHAWMDAIDATPGQAVLFLAEGLFPYFTEGEVRGLVEALNQRFPGSELVCEGMSTIGVWFSSRHPSVGKTSARFHWGIKTGRSMAGWVPGIRFVDEWYFHTQHPERWRWLRWLRYFPPVRKLLKIIHLELAGPSAGRV